MRSRYCTVVGEISLSTATLRAKGVSEASGQSFELRDRRITQPIGQQEEAPHAGKNARINESGVVTAIESNLCVVGFVHGASNVTDS